MLFGEDDSDDEEVFKTKKRKPSSKEEGRRHTKKQRSSLLQQTPLTLTKQELLQHQQRFEQTMLLVPYLEQIDLYALGRKEVVTKKLEEEEESEERVRKIEEQQTKRKVYAHNQACNVLFKFFAHKLSSSSSSVAFASFARTTAAVCAGLTVEHFKFYNYDETKNEQLEDMLAAQDNFIIGCLALVRTSCKSNALEALCKAADDGKHWHTFLAATTKQTFRNEFDWLAHLKRVATPLSFHVFCSKVFEFVEQAPIEKTKSALRSMFSVSQLRSNTIHYHERKYNRTQINTFLQIAHSTFELEKNNTPQNYENLLVCKLLKHTQTLNAADFDAFLNDMQQAKQTIAAPRALQKSTFESSAAAVSSSTAPQMVVIRKTKKQVKVTAYHRKTAYEAMVSENKRAEYHIHPNDAICAVGFVVMSNKRGQMGVWLPQDLNLSLFTVAALKDVLLAVKRNDEAEHYTDDDAGFAPLLPTWKCFEEFHEKDWEWPDDDAASRVKQSESTKILEQLDKLQETKTTQEKKQEWFESEGTLVMCQLTQSGYVLNRLFNQRAHTRHFPHECRYYVSKTSTDKTDVNAVVRGCHKTHALYKHRIVQFRTFLHQNLLACSTMTHSTRKALDFLLGHNILFHFLFDDFNTWNTMNITLSSVCWM